MHSLAIRACMYVRESVTALKSGLRPVYFQLVVDALDTINMSYRFLGHLLLKVRSDNAFQHHSTLIHDAAKLVSL